MCGQARDRRIIGIGNLVARHARLLLQLPELVVPTRAACLFCQVGMFVAAGLFKFCRDAHRIRETLQQLPVAVGGKGTDMRVQQGGYGVIVETLAEPAVIVLGVYGGSHCAVLCHVSSCYPAC